MRRTLTFVLLLASFSASAMGQDNVVPGAPGTPSGWQVGGDMERYEVGAQGTTRDRPGTAYIKAGPGAECGDFGALFQTIAADKYRGKRLKFSARLLEEHMAGGDFNLFIFVRGPDGNGTVQRAPWDGDSVRNFYSENFRNESASIGVPADAQEITFGVRLAGPGGTGSVEAVRLETTGDFDPASLRRDLPRARFARNAEFQNRYFLGWYCARQVRALVARGLLDRDERDVATLPRRSAPQDVQRALPAP